MDDITSRFLKVYEYLYEKKIVHTDKELAKRLGVGASAISNIVAGTSKVGLNIIVGMSSSFTMVNLNWLLTGSEQMLETKTPLNSEEERGGNRFEEKEDVISLLREIRDEQKELSISYRTISDALLKDHNMPADKDPTLTTEQITAAVQQMIDQRSYGPKQSDFSQQELKGIAKGANNSKKHEVPGKSEVSSDAKKAEKSHAVANSKKDRSIPEKGGASRK